MKKVFLLALCLACILSLAACGGAVENMASNTKSAGESIVSDTESVVDSAKNSLKDDSNSMNLMAGITANDALSAALNHAALTESQVSDVDIDLDRDNGRLIYEVDFNFENTEYDYDINAETGEVISSDKSRD